jgi:RNA polymerase sigma-70 factor, ECF subfamily
VADDGELLERLRAGDEDAFMEVVRAWSPSMVRVARMYVPSGAVAEEVVQETWLGVLRGLDRFEGRSSLKTWVFRILVNRARTRGERERRTVPFAALAGASALPARRSTRAPGRRRPTAGTRTPSARCARARRSSSCARRSTSSRRCSAS